MDVNVKLIRKMPEINSPVLSVTSGNGKVTRRRMYSATQSVTRHTVNAVAGHPCDQTSPVFRHCDDCLKQVVEEQVTNDAALANGIAKAAGTWKTSSPSARPRNLPLSTMCK